MKQHVYISAARLSVYISELGGWGRGDIIEEFLHLFNSGELHKKVPNTNTLLSYKIRDFSFSSDRGKGLKPIKFLTFTMFTDAAEHLLGKGKN